MLVTSAGKFAVQGHKGGEVAPQGATLPRYPAKTPLPCMLATMTALPFLLLLVKPKSAASAKVSTLHSASLVVTLPP